LPRWPIALRIISWERSMETAEEYDVVIIGSGFGGSINAIRLDEAVRWTQVLQRGRRYRPGSYPRDVTDVRRLFWRYPFTPIFRVYATSDLFG